MDAVLRQSRLNLVRVNSRTRVAPSVQTGQVACSSGQLSGHVEPDSEVSMERSRHEGWREAKWWGHQ